MAMDGTERVDTRLVMGHHDFVEHADGTVGYLGLEFETVEVDGEAVEVASDYIVEVPEGADENTESTKIFSFLDDYVNPYRMCEHFEHSAYGTEANDWTHSNSLMFDPNDQAYFLLSKNLSALFKIDRASGEIVWQMGGDMNEFAPIGGSSDTFWNHGHMSQIWDGGFVMFDNGYHGDEGQNISRIVEYSYDEQSRTVEKVFEYVEPDGRFVEMLGDVKKLPNGNYFVSWSTAGYLTEIDRQGNVVWQADLEIGNVAARATWVSDLYTLF
jgi:hypothetical protein